MEEGRSLKLSGDSMPSQAIFRSAGLARGFNNNTRVATTTAARLRVHTIHWARITPSLAVRLRSSCHQKPPGLSPLESSLYSLQSLLTLQLASWASATECLVPPFGSREHTGPQRDNKLFPFKHSCLRAPSTHLLPMRDRPTAFLRPFGSVTTDPVLRETITQASPRSSCV